MWGLETEQTAFSYCISVWLVFYYYDSKYEYTQIIHSYS